MHYALYSNHTRGRKAQTNTGGKKMSAATTRGTMGYYALNNMQAYQDRMEQLEEYNQGQEVEDRSAVCPECGKTIAYSGDIRVFNGDIYCFKCAETVKASLQ